MSEELEALEDIILYLNANEPMGFYCNNIKILKTALKKQEEDQKYYNKIARANLEIGQTNCRLNELVDKQFSDLIKLETFVEIIVKKNVCIHDLKKSKTVEEYNGCREWEEQLTQEEFELLKEKLL